MPPPPPGQIDVWWLPITSLAPSLPDLGGCLSPAEQARRDRFVRPEDQVRFAICRASLRHLLAAYTGGAPAAIAFELGERGKPFLAGHPVEFNLSHSGDWGVVAIGRRPLGVDVERMKPIREFDLLVERYFSPDEQRQMAAFDPADRIAAFYRAWSRKEAFMKATGEGLHLTTTSFTVTLAAEAAALLAGAGIEAWSCANLSATPAGYSAALITEGPIAGIRERPFDPAALCDMF